MTKGSNSAKWWKSVIIGEGPQVDVDKIEGSQYVDQSLIDRLEREEQEREEAEKKQKEQSTTPESDQ